MDKLNPRKLFGITKVLVSELDFRSRWIWFLSPIPFSFQCYFSKGIFFLVGAGGGGGGGCCKAWRILVPWPGIEPEPRKWKQSLNHCCACQSCLTLCDPLIVACQPPLSMRFPRQEYWSGLAFPYPGDLPNPGVEPEALASPGLIGRFLTTEPSGKP